MADALDTEGSWLDGQNLVPAAAVKRGQMLHPSPGGVSVVGDMEGPEGKGQGGIGLTHLRPEGIEEVIAPPPPLRPLAGHSGGEILSPPEGPHGQVTDRPGQQRDGQVPEAPDQSPRGPRPVAGPAHLGPDDERGAQVEAGAGQADQLAAGAVAQEQEWQAWMALPHPPQGSFEIQPSPLFQGGWFAPQPPVARVADAAVVEGQHGQAGLGQVDGQAPVDAPGHPGGAGDHHRPSDLGWLPGRAGQQPAILSPEDEFVGFHRRPRG